MILLLSLRLTRVDPDFSSRIEVQGKVSLSGHGTEIAVARLEGVVRAARCGVERAEHRTDVHGSSTLCLVEGVRPEGQGPHAGLHQAEFVNVLATNEGCLRPDEQEQPFPPEPWHVLPS